MNGLMTIDESEENDYQNDKFRENYDKKSKIRKQLKFDDTKDTDDFELSNLTSNGSLNDNSPIIPGINGRTIKSFEELIEEKLRNEENHRRYHDAHEVPKRPFLKKGAGLMRFGNTKFSENTTKICRKRCDPINYDKRKSNGNGNARNDIKCGKIKDSKVQKSVKLTVPSDVKTIEKKDSQTLLKLDNFNTKLKKLPVLNPNIMARNAKQRTEGNNDIIITRNVNINPNTDIDDLESLLKKIEVKRNVITDHLRDIDDWSDIECDNGDQRKGNALLKKKFKRNNYKKRVRLSNKSGNKSKIQHSPESKDNDISLEEPRLGSYTLSLQRQIKGLENKLYMLKENCECKNESSAKVITQCNAMQKPNDHFNDIRLMREKMELLNNRIKNLESQKYESVNHKHKKNVIIERNIKSDTSDGIDIKMTKCDSYSMYDFPNGDKIKISKDNTVFHTYSNGASQVTYSDGLKIITFPNGQIEKVHKNGVKHITYTDGTKRIINPDSSEEVFLNDGSVIHISNNGTESLVLPNGDREIRTENFKRREYFNGTIKTLYADGTQETRYPNGRLRIKDKNGNLMVDSQMKNLHDY